MSFKELGKAIGRQGMLGGDIEGWTCETMGLRELGGKKKG